MGAIQAEDMVNTGMFPMETMLYWHLSGNLFPSHAEFIDVALAAIEAANMGDYDATINIAEIMEDEKYNHAAPVHEIIDAWHLEYFLSKDEEDY